jgi:hypothetical protein
MARWIKTGKIPTSHDGESTFDTLSLYAQPDAALITPASLVVDARPVFDSSWQFFNQLAFDIRPTAAGKGIDTDSFPQAHSPSLGTSSASTLDGNTATLAATIPALAGYLVNGFWQYEGTIAHHWASSTITYNINGLTTAESLLVQSALNAWHEVTNLTFVQTTGAANITYNHAGSLTAYETDNYNGSGIISSATIDISADWITTDGGAHDGKTGIDSYGYQTYIHETGHALGLGHQGPYNGSASYSTDAIFANDTWQYSVMSYFSEQNYNGGSYRYVITPQMADIYAVDSIYGAATTRSGNTVYGFHDTAGSIFDFTAYTQAPSLTIYDSGGTDTLDCSGYSAAQIIDLHPGSFSSVGGLVHNIGIATNATIEVAIGGSGNDVLIANDLGCTLTGGTGNDSLNGGAGIDTAIYSAVSSNYQITQNSDGSWTITDLRIGANDGVDTLWNTEFLQFANGIFAISIAPGNHVPTVAASNVTATSVGQNIAASSLFSYSDADGRAATKYQFGDGTGGSSGYFVVNGAVQGVGVEINVSAAQLAQTTFQTAPGTDQLYVRAFDGFNWSDWKGFTVTGLANHAPTVTASNLTATSVGQNIAASSLLSYSDADGQAATKYQFGDGTGGSSGYFVVNGAVQGVGVEINVSAAQLAQTTFQTAPGTDQLYVRAFDGFDWSDWKAFTVTGLASPANHAPTVTASNVTATSVGQNIAASSLFSYSDADGQAATKYQFGDGTGGSSGYFVVNGAVQGVGIEINVSAAQLAQTTFQTAPGTDQLYVRAFDGFDWSDWKAFTVAGLASPANHAPTVTASNLTATSVGQNIAASSLFSYSDADGQAATKYQFGDGTGGSSGYFVVNGAVQGVGVEINVSVAQLAQTTFQTAPGADQLYVRAFDGFDWSDWKAFTITGLASQANHAPTVTASNVTTTSVGQNIAASSLFSYSDADGQSATQYQFGDGTGGASGHFVVNGVTQGVGVEINVSAAQLAQTTFQTAPGTDQLYVRAFDGFDWGDWKAFTVTGLANHAPTVTASNITATSVGQNIAASSLFSYSDADGQAATKFQFGDGTDGSSGHFVVNGVTQGVGVEINVSAVQLAQTTFQTAPGTDQLYVRAFDGFDWSEWKAFTVTGQSNNAPIHDQPNETPPLASDSLILSVEQGLSTTGHEAIIHHDWIV